MISDIADFMESVRRKRPLVHHITNYVTVNDCANVALCAGGSPVMTDSAKDIDEMVSLASAVVLNIGTLNERTIESMIQAGKAANKKGIPVILDPVGAGATKYRTDTVWKILDNVKVSIIKGNEGEIGFLAGEGGKVVGVDSEGMSGDKTNAAKSLAIRTKTVVAMTGKEDVVSDGTRTCVLNNGHDLMGTVSGTGCMASSVVGCYAGTIDNMFSAAVAAITVFNVAGEIAATKSSGPGTFKVNLMDVMQNLTGKDVTSKAKVGAL